MKHRSVNVCRQLLKTIILLLEICQLVFVTALEQQSLLPSSEFSEIYLVVSCEHFVINNGLPMRHLAPTYLKVVGNS